MKKALVVFAIVLAVATSVSVWPRNNRRLVQYEGYYFIRHQGYWELIFYKSSQLWLHFPDGSSVFSQDVTQRKADELLDVALRDGDTLSYKSDDIFGNPDMFYRFDQWCLDLTFDESGNFRYGKAHGKLGWQNGRSTRLPGGITFGLTPKGPFHDLIGTRVDDLVTVFGEPTEIRNYNPPPGP